MPCYYKQPFTIRTARWKETVNHLFRLSFFSCFMLVCWNLLDLRKLVSTYTGLYRNGYDFSYARKLIAQHTHNVPWFIYEGSFFCTPNWCPAKKRVKAPTYTNSAGSCLGSTTNIKKEWIKPRRCIHFQSMTWGKDIPAFGAGMKYDV